MSSQNIMKLDSELLEAKIFHGLKSLCLKGDTLPPRYLEIVACQVFNLKHTGDGNFFADGVSGTVQASVKTRKLDPDIKVKISSRDFQSHPDKFLGYAYNRKQGLIWEGLEFIQRRQAFPDDLKMSPDLIGKLSIDGFRENIVESKNKFKTVEVYEILIIHGYARDQKNYIVSLYWQEYQEPDIKTITWSRKGDAVFGKQKQMIDGKLKDVIICKRFNGNAKRTATNYAEYKNPTKYKYSASISVPIPDLWYFNKEKILAELQNLKELSHDNSILLTE
jgi:hypothetical protein